MHNSPSKEGKCTASDEQQVALVEASNTNDGSRLNARDAVAQESVAIAAADIYEMSAHSANSNNNSNQQVFFSL